MNTLLSTFGFTLPSTCIIDTNIEQELYSWLTGTFDDGPEGPACATWLKDDFKTWSLADKLRWARLQINHRLEQMASRGCLNPSDDADFLCECDWELVIAWMMQPVLESIAYRRALKAA